ncbi:MAG: 3-dehydroquinate synthase [Bacteroidales bacterium]|nr:3-dehydroquinate synthase [Bacteroidales bacterium]
MQKIKISGSLASLKFLLFKYKKVLVVYDRKMEALADQISQENKRLAIAADERHKTMDTVMTVCRWLLSNKADKETLLLAVGGGVTTDIAGFAASIYKRGIRYANVPTTLLAMVDASIGGKTGVNLDSYKNMLGTVCQPQFTFIYPKVLETLPEREIRNGAAEMLKTFIIKNRHNNYADALALLKPPVDFKALEPLIEAAAKVKRDIVYLDEFEKGPRRVLNLGHTYAHAIEWWQQTKADENVVPTTALSHGEAVAIGIVKAAELSADRGFCDESLPQQLKTDLESVGLPTGLPCPEEELAPALLQDKKISGKKINFVFIKRIGKVKVKKHEFNF